MPAVLALDQGTTGSTALLVGDDGSIRGRGYYELHQHYPHPGWVEHDPDAIWETTIAAARDAMGSERPAAIGITNQLLSPPCSPKRMKRKNACSKPN